MKINNYEEVVKQLTSDENLLITVLIDSGAEQKLGHKYSCPCCKSKDNLNIFSNEGVWFYKCFTSGCFAGTGTVIQYVQHLKGYEKPTDAIMDIVNNYAPYIRIDQDDDFQKMDDFLSRYSIDGHENLRHHYYKNKEGIEVGAKVLFRNNETKKKTGIWFKITENRAIVCSKKTGVAVEDILYNAHQIKDSTEHICITEGEKDADTLSRLGFIATTSQASNKWVDTYTEQIKHCKNFYIFADNDEAGKKSADMIVAALKKETGEYSTDHAIKIINMPLDIPKADISDYVEILKEKGLNHSQIKNEIFNLIKRSENLIAKNVIHRSDEGYFKFIDIKDENGNKSVVKLFVSDFTIDVLCHNYNIDNDNDSSYDVAINTQNGRIMRVFKNTSMNSIKEFNEALNTPFASFWGKSKDLIDVKKYIFSKTFKEQKIVDYAGLREIDNEIVYIEADKCLINGSISDKYIYKDESGIRSNLLNYNAIDSEGLNKLSERLLNFNNEYLVYTILGLSAATFFKKQLSDNNIKFPNQEIVGEAGSGKSETTDFIIKPMFGLEGEMNTAKGITKFSANKKLSSNNMIPLLIDDYKPTKMTAHEIQTVDSYMNSSYDRTTFSRGTKYLGVINTTLRTNIILTGERKVSESSATERSMMCMFSKKESFAKDRTENFAWLKENKELLNQLGRTLLNISMNTDKDTVKEIYKAIHKSIKDKCLQPRIASNIAVVGVGLTMLNILIKTIDVGEAVNLILSTMNEVAKVDAKTEVEKHLELIDQMIGFYGDRDKEGYKLFVINSKNELCLRIKDIYPLLVDYTRKHVDGFKPLQQAEFVSQLYNSKYCSYTDKKKWYSAVRFTSSSMACTSKNIKSYRLDIKELAKLELENMLTERDIQKATIGVVENGVQENIL